MDRSLAEENSRRPTTTVTIGAELAVEGLPARLEHEVLRACIFPNPERSQRERLGLGIDDTPQLIEAGRRTASGIIVPRGASGHVDRACRHAGIEYALIDQTIAPPLEMELAVAGNLHPYQETAIGKLLRNRIGLLQAPTGSGKGCMIAELPARLNTSTLILVHTRALLEQTRDRVASWLACDVGVLGGGQWDMRPISAATIQTLARRDLDELGRHFGCIVVDECHHAPARTWCGVVNSLPARYKYGFTATPWRKDGLAPLMKLTLGPITAKIGRAEVEAFGAIVTPVVETVETDFYFDLEYSLQWTQMIGALVTDEDRNRLLVSELRGRLEPETRALILSDRIAHCNVLAKLLEDLGPVVLTGELSASAREAAMAAVHAGARLTIATSALLGEGVDMPGWDLLIMATPMAGGPRTLQAVGRVTRAAPGKDRAVVVDLVDVRVSALVAAWRKRERLYAA